MQVARIGLVALTAAVVVALGVPSQPAFGQVTPKLRPAQSETAAPKKVPPPKTVTKKQQTAPETKTAKIDHGSVYLLRGLANIFSLGMNTLGDQLEANGVDNVVTNHSHGFDIADKLARRYETDKSVLPIILIGHSLGANKTLTMAARLAEKNVPIRLIVLFDATAQLPVPNNVQEVLNLHKPSSMGVAVSGVRGYKGTIDNKDVSAAGVGHISIDKSRKLHAEVVAKVLAVLAETPTKQPVAKKPKPMVKKPEAKAPEAKAAEVKPPVKNTSSVKPPVAPPEAKPN